MHGARSEVQAKLRNLFLLALSHSLVYNKKIMVVRMRHTRAHTANRRSHHALEGARLSKCVKCEALHLRHQVCVSCGTYRGKTVMKLVKTMAKLEKRVASKTKAVK